MKNLKIKMENLRVKLENSGKKNAILINTTYLFLRKMSKTSRANPNKTPTATPIISANHAAVSCSEFFFFNFSHLF